MDESMAFLFMYFQYQHPPSPSNWNRCAVLRAGEMGQAKPLDAGATAFHNTVAASLTSPHEKGTLGD
jgi:hypothetical protein